MELAGQNRRKINRQNKEEKQQMTDDVNTEWLSATLAASFWYQPSRVHL